MIELIRKLSHVNTEFRAELGAAFWDKVQLNLDDTLTYSMNSLPSLRAFLEERPAAGVVIETFTMMLSIEDLPEDNPQPFADFFSFGDI